MSNVARQIYRELDALIPNLEALEPYTRVDLKDRGFPNINAVVFDSQPDRINLVLSRYVKDGRRMVANPSFEITANPKMQLANVVTYKDDHYFHSAEEKPEEVREMAQSTANRLLYELLTGLKKQQGAGITV